MDVRRIEDMVGGWFVGNFDPSVFRTHDFEVAYKVHHKGDSWGKHYHKRAIEINYLIRGRMQIQGKILTKGDIFTIFPYEISDPEFIEDCELIVVKLPSVIGDKYEVTESI